MVRINDPTGRFTVQQGLGVAAGNTNNGSADIRYGVDPDNYTVTFSSGYPACIPSTVPRNFTDVNDLDGDNDTTEILTAQSLPDGTGDLLCPDTNRPGKPVPNSFVFAPIQLGDHIAAEGNFENLNGVRFLSAHTLTVHSGLTTANGQPDYMIFDEAEWDVAGFQNQRARVLLIGFTTHEDSQADIFSLHVNPADNSNNEFPLASTIGNPDTINQGILPNNGHIFKIVYDVDFIAGAGAGPCLNLSNAFSTGPTGVSSPCTPAASASLAQNFNVLSPISREIIGRTQIKQFGNSGGPFGDSQDILGNPAPNGEYLTPVGIGHPEFVEINLDAIQTPFIFTGEPWNLDRRLGPGGCDGSCESTPQPLDPFPYSGLDPRTQAAGPGQNGQVPLAARDRILSFYPFGSGDLLAWPPADPPFQSILPTPVADLVCAAFLEKVKILNATYQTANQKLVVAVNNNGGDFLSVNADWGNGSGLLSFVKVLSNGQFRYRGVFKNIPAPISDATVTSSRGGADTRVITVVP